MGENNSGCHVDNPDGYEDEIYSDCVIDSGDHEQCAYASIGMAKEDCEYWREVK